MSDSRTGQESKLIGKAKNLVEAFHALRPSPPVVLLMGWTLSGTDVTQARKSVKAVARDGFRSSDNSWVPGVADPYRFLVYFAIFGKYGRRTQADWYSAVKLAEVARGVEIGGRFRLVDILGRGSYGEVWLAEVVSGDAELPSKVALKIFNQQERADAALLKGGANGRPIRA